MTSSETVKRRRKKGRGLKSTSTTSNDKDATIAKLQLIIERQQKLLEVFRNRATQQIASDNGSGPLEEERAATDSAYRLLWSYGYDTDELRKGWKALGKWREW